jgi:hypothetical protein
MKITFKKRCLPQRYHYVFTRKNSDIGFAMAGAKRPQFPGQVWHLTHQCLKREFLL